jgi:hypothetical protein
VIFRGERTAKLVFTSVLIAQFASAVPFLTGSSPVIAG